MEGKIGIVENGSHQASDLESNKSSEDILNQSAQIIRTVCQFFLNGRCRFGEDCHNFHDPKLKTNLGDKIKETQQKNNFNKQTKNIGRDYKAKRKMRTAIDVIHRIQWDDAIPEELITIGYEDRFKGIQVNFLTILYNLII